MTRRRKPTPTPTLDSVELARLKVEDAMGAHALRATAAEAARNIRRVVSLLEAMASEAQHEAANVAAGSIRVGGWPMSQHPNELRASAAAHLEALMWMGQKSVAVAELLGPAVTGPVVYLVDGADRRVCALLSDHAEGDAAITIGMALAVAWRSPITSEDA